MKCVTCDNTATSLHEWTMFDSIDGKQVPIEEHRYPFCSKCHQEVWDKTSKATNFILTARIRSLEPNEVIERYIEPIEFAMARAIGDKNDPILDSVG